MPATPTRAQSANQVKDAVRLVNDTLGGVSPSLPNNELTLISNLNSDFAAEQASGAASFRAQVAQVLNRASVALTPPLVAFVKHQIPAAPERTIQPVLSRIYLDLIANAETIQSRNMNFGPAVPNGGNVGTGVIFRLNKDEANYDLEATHPDLKTVICVRDVQGGATQHEESFRIRGSGANVDSLEVAGSGRSVTDSNTSSKTSKASQLKNAGFEEFALGSATFSGDVAALASDSSVTGWELLNPGGASDPTLFDVDRTPALQYRVLSGVTTPISLRMKANARLRQAFSVNRVRLVFSRPYTVVFHVKPENAADGSITVTWGSKSQVFTVGSLTAGVWNKVSVDLDLDLWPQNFNQNAPVYQIEWSGRTTGELLFDEIESLMEWGRFDGHWFHVSGGLVNWLNNDQITFTDSLVGSDSELQNWLFRAYGRHLPHSGTPSANWVEPF